MRIKFVAALTLVCISFTVCAQTDTASIRPSWFLSLHSGALFGKPGNGTSASATLRQGIRLDRFSVGVGVGYDAYTNWQTLPLFTGVAYDLVKGEKGRFFLQLDVGYSYAWERRLQETPYIYDNEGGFFTHPSVGYRVHGGKFTLYFSAGYKFQRLTYNETPEWWVSGTPGIRRTVTHDIERLSVQIGVGLW